MNFKYILIFFFLMLFLGPVFSVNNYLSAELKNYKNIYNIFEIYALKSNTDKEVDLTYVIQEDGNISPRIKIYRDIIISDIRLEPNIGLKNKNLVIDSNIQDVYFLTNRSVPNLDRCQFALNTYYSKISYESVFNINNKDSVIDRILVPLTKDKIISYLENNQIVNSESCFNSLVSNKVLISYPILLNVKFELKGEPSDFERNYNFILNFYPEFNSLVRPIKFNLKFKQEPIQIISQYSTPNGCETKTDANFCYITKKDVDFFSYPRYVPTDLAIEDEYILSLLNNFTLVKNFGDQYFEEIYIKDLILHLIPIRERFCFREENEGYHKVIFDTAKAYNLSLEQTFQLWAIISERSNCNYIPNFNKNLKGFTQISLNNRDSGNLIELDPSLPKQLAEEEQFQYLALGDFTEINQIVSEINKGNRSLYYDYGYNGLIYNDNGYFGFLINAIKRNSDNYGSTILFSSDYLKELNLLVKNSRFTYKPYTFKEFIVESSASLNYLYVLGSLMSDNNQERKDLIYSTGDFVDAFEDVNFFVKSTHNRSNIQNTYIKTTKEARILINYLAIKRKYYNEPSLFSEYGVLSESEKTSSFKKKITLYEGLDANYWNTIKEKYLGVLFSNDLNLLIKKSNYYNYNNLIKISGTPNLCARYVKDFGSIVYSNGNLDYPDTGANAWTYDTKQEAIEAYNLIWEAKDICLGKIPCTSVPTTRNCCQEDVSVQNSLTYLPNNYFSLLIDGAILGIKIPTSRYNTSNNEYSHVGTFIGKSIYGDYLMAHSGSGGQKILRLRDYINNSSGVEILRIYLPKSTNVYTLSQIGRLNLNLPSSYITKIPVNVLKFDPDYDIEAENFPVDEVIEDMDPLEEPGSFEELEE